jgi:hypothetical protein
MLFEKIFCVLSERTMCLLKRRSRPLHQRINEPSAQAGIFERSRVEFTRKTMQDRVAFGIPAVR